MTRIDHEEQIIGLLRAVLPPTVEMESMPLGPHDSRFLDVRDAAVRVVYEGGVPRPASQNHPNSNLHVEDWTWAVIVLAKNYRSPREGAASALELLEQVIDVLDSAKIDGRRLTRLGDQLLPLDEGVGLMGYMVRFSIYVFVPRGK